MTEALVARYLSEADWQARLTKLRSTYQKRRDVLCEAVERHLPLAECATYPTGGYFLYLRLPGVNTKALLKDALAAGVSFVAGSHFYDLGRGGENELRLSFSYVGEEQLVEGVWRLSQVTDRHLRR